MDVRQVVVLNWRTVIALLTVHHSQFDLLVRINPVDIAGWRRDLRWRFRHIHACVDVKVSRVTPAPLELRTHCHVEHLMVLVFNQLFMAWVWVADRLVEVDAAAVVIPSVHHAENFREALAILKTQIN